jgi:hypothetical protein
VSERHISSLRGVHTEAQTCVCNFIDHNTSSAHFSAGSTAPANPSAWLMQQSGALPLCDSPQRVLFPKLALHSPTVGESALTGSALSPTQKQRCCSAVISTCTEFGTLCATSVS